MVNYIEKRVQKPDTIECDVCHKTQPFDTVDSSDFVFIDEGSVNYHVCKDCVMSLIKGK